MEDHAVTGGFGTGIGEALLDMDVSCPVKRIGWPDEFVEHGSSVASLREAYGLSNEAITEQIMRRLKALKSTGASVSN